MTAIRHFGGDREASRGCDRRGLQNRAGPWGESDGIESINRRLRLHLRLPR